MSQVIDEARAEYERAMDELLQNFAKMPDDRVNWSPAPTARTPVEIVAHCAEAIGHLTEMMHGQPFGSPRTAEADQA
ncbi:MAG: DinB family protein, partial [Armatimonadetes bacterium]|nr:DinB family protein [Armatimonadota bacterium]